MINKKVKDFDTAIRLLNQLLKKMQPQEFGTSWIKANSIGVYQYICENIRTEYDDVDWDKVTSCLDRSFQSRWNRTKPKKVEPYNNQSEVGTVLSAYKDKLYSFIAPIDDNDKYIRHKMIISLVRIGQKGNLSAYEELIKWITFLTDEWIDCYPQIRRWKGYSDEVEEKIKTCIRCYRYTGSFLTYLFRTLEYSARGKPPGCSLDDPIAGGKRTRVDFVLVS